MDRTSLSHNRISYSNTAPDFYGSGIGSLNTFQVGQVGKQAEIAESWNELENEIDYNLENYEFLPNDLVEEQTDKGISKVPGMGATYSVAINLTKAVQDIFNPQDKYTGNDGKKSSYAEQAFNINVRDALSINVTSRSEELRKTEGRWLPEIDVAKKYLEQKKTLALLSPETEGYKRIVNEVEKLETEVRELAKTNPYIRDIFYGEATEPPFTHPGQLYPRRVSKDIINKALENNKNNYLIDLSWNQNNNELSDKLTSVSKIDNKLAKLQQSLEEASVEFKEKDEDIKSKMTALKTKHMLYDPLFGIIPTGLTYDPDIIDPVFDQQRNTAEISILDPSTYKYGLTHLGSSYSELQAMGATMLMANAIRYGSKLAGSSTGPLAPLVWAGSEAAFNILSTNYFRNKETAAEVMSNYAQKIIEGSENNQLPYDLRLVMEEFDTGLKARGFDTSKLEDLEKLQLALAYNIKSSDENYNKFAEQSRKGLTEIEQKNNALALMDYAQNFGLSYGGKLVKEAIGAQAIAKGAVNTLKRSDKVKKAIEIVENKIGKAVDKVFSNPMQKVATKRALNAIGEFALATGKRWASEAIEEGQQRIYSIDYLERPNEQEEKPYSIISGAFQAGDAAIDAILAYNGLHWNDLYNTDEELKTSMQIGGFIGALMGSAGDVSNLHSLKKQLKSDISLQKLAAEGFDKADTSFKTAQFLDAYRKGVKADNIRNSLESAKQYKHPEVTDDMINQDKELADIVYGIYSNKNISSNLKDLSINRKNDKEFELFVQNQVDLISRFKEAAKLSDSSNVKVNEIINNIFSEQLDNSLNQFIKQEYQKVPTDQNISFKDFRAPIINALVARATNRVLNKLNADLTNRKKTLSQVKDEYGIEISTTGIEGILQHIKNMQKSTQHALDEIDTKLFSGTLKTLKDPSNIVDLENALTVQIVNNAVSDILGTKVQAYTYGRLPISNRYMIEQKPLYSTLDDAEKQSVLTQYAEEWKKEHNTNKEPTQKQIISYYNHKINKAWSELENNSNVEANERTLANAMFREDISKAKKELQKAKEELNEDLGVEEKETTEQNIEEIQQQKPKTTVIPDTDKGVDKKETSQEAANTSDTVSDSSNRKGQVIEVDKIETEDKDGTAPNEAVEDGSDTVVGDIDSMLDDVADEKYVADEEIIEINEGPTDEQEKAIYDKVDDSTLEEDELRAKFDRMEEGEPLADINEIGEEQSGTSDIESQPAQTDEQPTVKEQEKQPKQPITLSPKPDSTKQKKVTVVVESYDGSTDEEIEVPIDDQESVIYSDGTDVWVGNEDPELGTRISDEDLQMANEFEMVDAVDMSTTQEAANYLGQTDKSPGLDTKKKVETNRIHSTFFYAFSSTEVMPIEANDKPVEFDGERRPGSELAEKLAIPGWLAKQKTYYIVTDSKETRKNEKDAADRLAVHLIIEETTEDGKKLIYNTSLYQPDKARTKISKWKVSNDKRNYEINKLRQLRKSIIDKYITTYAPDYFVNPNTKLPQVAQKGIIPVNLRQSNGSINSIASKDKRPVYKPLTTVNELGLSSDPLIMSRQIIDGDVEFGYGKGAFSMNPNDAYSIVQFDQVTRTSAQGVGYAGKIYVIPKIGNTPSQSHSAPIMLAEKRHFIKGGSKNLVTSYTPDGKAKYDDNGKRVPLSTAELLFRLVTKTLPIANNPEFVDLLDVLVNHGPGTVTVGDNRVEKLSFYVRKTLHYYTNAKGSFLMYAQRTPEGSYLLKYLKIKDTNGKVVFTEQQAYDVIRQISNNLHWNTDKQAMMEPISNNIVEAAINHMNEFGVDTYKPLNCEDLEFTMQDLNLVKGEDGKVVRNGDTPILMSWMINHEVLKTDVGDTMFKDPFVYADDAAVAETAEVSKTEPTYAKKEKKGDSKAEYVKLESTKQIDTSVIEEKQTETPEQLQDKALTYDETIEAGLTPRQGFTYVQKADGSYVILPNSSKVLKKLLNQEKGVYSVIRGEGIVDIQEARRWIHKVLGIDPEDVLATNAIMKTASVPKIYGLLQSSFDRIKNEFTPRITLSKYAGKGIEYHEAWHYVSLLILSPSQRDQVYSDFVRRNPQYSTLNKQEVEEVLAEEFRSYMLKETNPTLGYLVRKFFRSVWNLVSKLGGRQLDTQNAVFSAIRKGRFKDAVIDQYTLEEFSKENPGGVPFYAPGISDEEQKKISHITNANTMYNIVEALSSTALATLNIQTMDDINNLKLDDVFDIIKYMYESGEYDDAETKKQIVSDVLENKELFAKQIRSYLQDLGIKSIERESTEIAEQKAKDEGETYDNIWDRASYEISKKANTAFNAKLFFYSIPQSKFILDENGNEVLDSVKDNIFGLDIAQSFDISWNKILDNLWESNDWPDLISKVRNLAKADPFFARLLERIDNPAFPLPENTVTELLTTIQSAKNSMDTVEIIDTSTGKIAKGSHGRGSKVWNVLDSSSLRKIARLPNQWSQNFLLSSMVTTDNNNRSRINTTAFSTLSKLDKEILNNINKINKNLNSKNAEVRKENLQLFEQTKQKFLDLVNMIGIPFDMESLNYMLNKIESGKEDFSEFFIFKTLYAAGNQGGNGVSNSISNSVISNIRAMNNAKSLETTFKKQRISASRIFNYNNPNAVINLMAIAYGNIHPTPEEFSVTGADGSLLYPVTQNNFMSDQLRWLNTNAYSKLDNLRDTPYSANSLIVKTLSKPNKPKLKLHTLIAINDNISNSSRDYFGITPLEDYITKLTLVHQGRIILPTMSDKKTWYSIEGIKMPKDFLSSIVTKPDAEGKMVTVTKSRRFSNDTLDIFCNYFLDEYNAIVKYYSTKSDVEKGKSRYYDNYHGNIGKDGKMEPGGNGGRFRYFNQMPINGKKVSLNKMLDAAEKSEDQQLINDVLNNIKKQFIDDKPLLRDSFNELLLEKVNKEIENAIKLGAIGRDKKGNLTYGNLPSTVVLEEAEKNNPFQEYEALTSAIPSEFNSIKQNDIIYSIIANYVTGYAVSIEELEKCFVGDPAFYKWKSDNDVGIFQRDVDKIKRLSSVLSTGTNLRTYWGENDPRNSTKFVSAILQDNMIGSEYHNKLQQIFKADLARTMLRKNNSQLTDKQLFELTDSKNINSTLNDRSLLSEADVSFIEKQAIKSANPYAYDDKENSGNINQADAAVYIRPAFYKRIVQSLGEWSPEIEEAFNILEGDPIIDQETGEVKTVLNDQELYTKALRASIKPLKMMYFGDHFDSVSGINVPIFDKMALFPMFKILATADNKYLYDRMNNEDLGTIDMIKFESAVKVGSSADKLRVYKDNKNTQLNIEDINKPSTTIITSNDTASERLNGGITTMIQDIKQLRLQLNTEPHAHTDRSFGTQAVKVCIGNVVDDRTYGSNKGLEVTGDRIKKDVFGCIKALSTKGYRKLKGGNGTAGRFFDKSGKLNARALSDYLIGEAKGTNMSAEVIEALQLDKNGNFKAPIASLSVRNWIESKIISLINKEVIDVNTPGGSAIQMASFGFKKNQVHDEEFGRAFNDGKKLSFDPDKGSMEVMLSTNFFRDVVPQEYQTDYTTMRNWLIKHNVIGNNAEPYGIGYRIPTQGLSSTFSFIVADVLPAQTGDTIVVPDEFTAMTGSDFDIDKLYIATYSYDPKTHERWKWNDDAKYFTDQTEGALINKLLDSYTLVISDQKTLAETRASIDTLTGILKKEILPLVQTTEIKEAEPMYELMPSFQESRKTEYTYGKAGIAPFALNSTNHCLTQATHLKMNFSDSAKKYNLRQFDEIDGQDGYKILDWLSAMINAHVDVAKDPYIIVLNVNKVTYNMASFLLRTGKGKSTFLFLAQPAIKEYANRKIMNEGVIGVSKAYDNQIFADIKDKYWKMLDTFPLTKSFKDDIKQMVEKGSIEAFNDSKLANSLEAFKTEDITPTDVVQQLLCIKAYQDLANDSQTMADLVQRSQIDTKKYGNNLSQLQNFYNSYTTFTEDNQKKFYTNDPEEGNGLETYFDNTFLRKKLVYMMDLSNNILKTQVYSATGGYKQLLTAVLQDIRGGNYTPTNNGKHLLFKYKATSNKDYVTSINNKIESIVRAKVIANNTELIMSDDEVNDLLFGKNSISRRLNFIKNYIRQHKDDINLISLVDSDGNIQNELLNYLQAITMTNKKLINYVSTATSSMNNSRYYEDRLRSGFYDLLTNDDTIIRDFAELLVKYAFLTSYDNRTPNSFFNIVPMWYKQSINYVDAIKESINKFNSGDPTATGSNSNFSDQINSIYLNMVRNYWSDNDIVPVFVRRVKEDEGGKTHSSNVINITSALSKNRGNVNTVISVTGQYDLSNNRKFFKIMRNNGDADLYQRVGDIIDVESGKTIERVYVAIPKLGYDAGSNSIYELYKEGNEQSAFSSNMFTDKMISQTTTELEDNINKRVNILNRKGSYTFVKDAEYQTVDFSNYENISEEAAIESTESPEVAVSVMNEESTTEIDQINHIDDTLLADLDSMESGETYYEDLSPAPDLDIPDVTELITEIAGSIESEIDIAEINEGVVNNLKEKGKQRKEECK